MNTELEKIAHRLTEMFDEQPWFGPQLLKKLQSIPFEYWNTKATPSKNDVARLLQHMINWRIFTIEKLKGNDDFNIELNSEADWSDVSISTEEDKNALINEFMDTQQQILELLKSKDDSLLDKPVGSRDYNFRYLLEGIIQHDIYHLGQIALVARIAQG